MPQRLRWGVMSTANIAQIALIPPIQQSALGTVEVLASRDIEKARRVAGSLEFAEGFATIGCSFGADGQGSYAIVGTERREVV